MIQVVKNDFESFWNIISNRSILTHGLDPNRYNYSKSGEGLV